MKEIRSKAVDPLFPNNCTPHHLSAQSDLVTLSMCKQVLNVPVDLECGVTICGECLISWMEKNETSACPHCDLGMDETHIKITSTCVSDMINNLLVSCPLDCQMIVRAENFNKHLKSRCKDFYESSPYSPSRVTAKEMMSRSSEIPMTPSEKSLAGRG